MEKRRGRVYLIQKIEGGGGGGGGGGGVKNPYDRTHSQQQQQLLDQCTYNSYYIAKRLSTLLALC